MRPTRSTHTDTLFPYTTLFRSVEAIAGEFVDQVEQLVRLGLLDPRNSLASIHEALALGIHFRLHLLAHRAAQQIGVPRSEEHTSELQPLMRISYAVFCLKKKK